MKWYTRGAPPKWNYLGTHLYQCTSCCCCERLHSVSVNFFEDSFNAFAHFTMGDLRAHLPTPRWVLSSFWPKMAWTQCPALPIHPISPWVTFLLFPQMKRVLKGKPLANVEEMTRRTAEALKSIKINELKTVLNSGKNVSLGALHQVERTLKVNKV